MSAPLQANALQSAAAEAMRRSADYLAGLQAADGHWQGDLTPAAPLDADRVLLDPSARNDRSARAILTQQLEDGGFHLYPGGPADVGASVKAYAALKLAGAGADVLAHLRDRIRSLGGIEAVNEWAKAHLHSALPLDELETSGGGLRKLWRRFAPKAKPLDHLAYRTAMLDGSGGSSVRDTALAALALAGSDPDHPGVQRAAAWLLAQPGGLPPDDGASVRLALAAAGRTATDSLGETQSKDGGWESADVTGRVLEALGPDHPAVRRGVGWLVENQEPDGSWLGRWGVAYLYGTCFALRGLAAAGESDREAHVLRGGEWLRSIQNADGGWGESCASYDNGAFTPAPSTPSQTAWSILGLIAGGDPNSLSARHGIDYLLRTQLADGSWDEILPTAVVLPKTLYARPHLYKDYWAPMALAAFAKARLDG